MVWTKVILNEFIEEALLTDRETEVVQRIAKGENRERIAYKMNMSLATLDRTIKNLKMKYDIVQKNSTILPPRK